MHPEDMAVPIMRTVFVHSDPAVCDRVRNGLARQAAALGQAQVASIRSADEASVEDWAIVGDRDAVAEQIGAYQTKFGMTHLIARGQVPGADGEQIQDSLRSLSELAKLVP